MEPLVHYVIVRRDLTVGQVCAQTVHAAGESVALLYAGSSGRVLGSSNVNREVGGANPSQRAIYGSGVAEDFGPVGANPASRASLPNDTIACVLSVRNDSRLLTLSRKLKSIGAQHVLIREPDLGNQATAIGIVPCRREQVGRALKDCIVFDGRNDA